MEAAVGSSMQREEATRILALREGISRWRPGSEVSDPEPMKGGMSAHLYSFEVDGEPVVARFPSAYLATLFPNPAAYEHRTLEALTQTGLPSPKPLLLSEGWLLMEKLPGRATAHPEDPSSYLKQMAQALANIHRVDLAGGLFDFVPPTKEQYELRTDQLPVELRGPETAKAVVGAGPMVSGPICLRHGDFWPGNFLWQMGKLTGIVDWENCLRGPALADLAISRLDVWWVLGREAKDEFTEHYLEAHPIPTRDLAYWDLRAALRPMMNLEEWADPYPSLDRPDITPSHLRSVLIEFIEDALRRWTG